ncbi:hypothetical protein L226DRAFT_195694 [Lentinus tigrinus ALCF2SS1-7]|uniref:uncharacterized protein n=1 Tax=Lentinus tigrinus ALCF2SS1-7 TaxID=1328758 RepID=UPI0011661024|nr:hypothetical protein L226DRAFT_195694 [Lentinus tigrinus ALCF2SS1-7]
MALIRKAQIFPTMCVTNSHRIHAERRSLRPGTVDERARRPGSMHALLPVRVPLRSDAPPKCSMLPSYQKLVRRGVTESIALAFLFLHHAAREMVCHQAGQFHQTSRVRSQLPTPSRMTPGELQLALTRTSESRMILRDDRSRITRGVVRRRSVIRMLP